MQHFDTNFSATKNLVKSGIDFTQAKKMYTTIDCANVCFCISGLGLPVLKQTRSTDKVRKMLYYKLSEKKCVLYLP